MIIQKRNPDISSPRLLNREAVELVLDWLLEFRFSSASLLSRRLGVHKSSAYRLLKSMEKRGLIRSYSNIHTNRLKYFMLTSEGAAYIQAWGRNISKAFTNSKLLSKYSTVIHDLSVQEVALARLDQGTELLWDFNIRQDKGQGRPDLLIYNLKGFWIGYEIERWKKNKPEIYMTFQQHVVSIENGNYNAVEYLFGDPVLLDYYRDLFDVDHHPYYVKDAKSGRLIVTNSDYVIDVDMRSLFRFNLDEDSFLDMGL